MAKQMQSCCGGNEKEEKSSCGCGNAEPKSAKHHPPPTTNPEPECSCGGPSKEITDFRSFCGGKRINMKHAEVTFAPTQLCATDLIDNFLVRFGFRRNNYAIKPGLYAVGSPDKDSPVLLSANYKMSFDALRKELDGIKAWILVLDTKGVNVWCAAGKGTFGTQQVIARVKAASLDKIVNHKNLISPQLGAPGIAAHEVRKKTGFKVIYGPVEAADIKAFLGNGMKADEKMRTVQFGLKKRLEVTGIEFMTALNIVAITAAVSVLAASVTKTGFSLSAGITNSAYFLAALLIAVFSSTIIPAALLPVIPGRMFSVKGAISGFATSLAFVLSVNLTPLTQASIVLLSTTLASFVFMNYTGTSTFTSLTGVRKEISDSAPVMIIAGVLGIILQIVDFVLKGGVKWN